MDMLIVLFSDCWCGKQNAQGMVEYALLLAFVAVLALAATLVGDSALRDAVLDTFAAVHGCHLFWHGI